MPARLSLGDRIRRAAELTGTSGYAIAKETGIGQPTIYKFLRGEHDLTLANADLVMRALGFEIIEPPAAKLRTRKKATTTPRKSAS
jgi:transcriptional regulator with XRE-family HTH domain